jgi:hypothetical protein
LPGPKNERPEVRKSPMMKASRATMMIVKRSTDLLLIFSNVAIDVFKVKFIYF